jgi:hypothetical protein
MTDEQVPAGWYDDPAGGAQLRYWDGARWTEHLHERTPAVAPSRPVANAAGAPSPATDGVAAAESAGVAGPVAPAAAGASVVGGLAAKKRRGPLIAVTVSLALVLALVAGVALAWGPVSAALFPKVALSDTEFYAMGEKNLFTDVAAPAHAHAIAYPGDNWTRASPGYRAAAQQYATEYVADYGADQRMFDSQAEADDYAYVGPYEEFSELGSVLNADGSGTPLATQSFPQVPEIVALEQQIASHPVAPGADGTYWDAAAQVAAIVGSEITRDESLNVCFSLDVEIVDPTAYFCPAPETWDLVFFTPAASEHPELSSLVDVMKHELAHKLISVQCGGVLHTDRALWQEEYGEGVTNSYAVVYLGADPAGLYAEGAYVMDARTEAKARAIHDGDLACFDEGSGPTP